MCTFLLHVHVAAQAIRKTGGKFLLHQCYSTACYNYFLQWQHNIGGICSWSLQSCGYIQGPQDNWVFTQFISKNTSASIDYEVKVCLNVTYRILGCRKPQCIPQIAVFRKIANGKMNESVVTDKSNYISTFFKKFSRGNTGRKTGSACFTLSPQERGFYLAVQDNSSCIFLSHMVVYRNECQEKREGLVLYPTFASPDEGSRPVIAQCVENAERVPSSSLAVSCQSNGTWVGTPECRCKAGYREVIVNKRTRCIGLSQGNDRVSLIHYVDIYMRSQ